MPKCEVIYVQALTNKVSLKLLNKFCEQSEQIIDTLHKAMPKGTRKPGNYRQRAGKAFLKVSERRRVGQKKLRKALRKQWI